MRHANVDTTSNVFTSFAFASYWWRAYETSMTGRLTRVFDRHDAA
jgi:hypothetical protein